MTRINKEIKLFIYIIILSWFILFIYIVISLFFIIDVYNTSEYHNDNLN